MSINGFMTNPLFSTTVYDGKKSLDDIRTHYLFGSVGGETYENMEISIRYFINCLICCICARHPPDLFSGR